MSITATTAVQTLTDAGYDEADVLAAIDSLIDAGLDAEQDDDNETLFSESDMAVIKAQLDSTN